MRIRGVPIRGLLRDNGMAPVGPPLAPLRHAAWVTAVAAAAAVAEAAPAAAPSPLRPRHRLHASKPNVVVLFADDFGWGDVGANWPSTTETPHMDALANSGLRFTDFHAMSVCTPSRASLLTGRLGLRTGVVVNFVTDSLYGLPTTEVTLPALLKTAGYDTAMLGKVRRRGSGLLRRTPARRGPLATPGGSPSPHRGGSPSSHPRPARAACHPSSAL
jgi:hypothetical protein